MSSGNSLTPEQHAAIVRLYEYDATILVAPTGAGKTVIALTAIQDLIEEGVLRKVVVAAPAKVIEKLIWPHEAAKWKHLRHIRIVQLEGDSAERTRRLLNSNGETHILMVSLNNLDWLLNQDHECDGIVVDELSKAAGAQTKGLKSKKRAGDLIWRIGMTATPVSQDFEKLWGMCRIIDHGRALGTNKQHYLEAHFYPDYHGYNWTLKGFADATILARVKGLVHLMEDDKVAALPPLHEHTISFDMPAPTRRIYDEMKRHMIADDVEAANQAVKSGKLRQLASGFMYDENGKAKQLDLTRATRVMDWCATLRGRPGLVFYEFVEQKAQLDALTPHNVQIAQVQSMSHGIDGLQDTYADVLFMQPIWSRDAAEQAVGRVWRQGQKQEVNVTTIMCLNSLDALVMARVEDRGKWMEIFRAHLEG